MLSRGDPAPDFTVRSNVNPSFHFNMVAGRYAVLGLFGTTRLAFAVDLYAALDRHREKFTADYLAFIGLSIDPNDPTRIGSEYAKTTRDFVFFWDFDQNVSRLYGAIEKSTPSAEPSLSVNYLPHSLVLDPSLRVIATLPHAGDAEAHVATILRIIDEQPKLDEQSTPAPALIVPNVFEPELCRALIDYYNANGGTDSGFMRDVDGKTVPAYDYSHKRRADCEIVDSELIKATQARIQRRIVPTIRQAFQFNANRIERHIVACYDASTGGHFKAHRDNTTFGTAHRRFAVTLNLNSHEFEGGELWFPEFSRRRYKAPTGGAVIFSCSILHEATPVTRGTRYAFLPFLYDDEAAKLRERNLKFVMPSQPPAQAATST